MYHLIHGSLQVALEEKAFPTYHQAYTEMVKQFNDSDPIEGKDECFLESAYNGTNGEADEWMIVGGHEYYEVVVYKSSIPNFPLKEDDDENLVELIIPDYIMKKWWKSKEEAKRLDLDYWYEYLSEADVTTDLYEFCMKQKYLPGILLQEVNLYELYYVDYLQF